MEKTSVIVALGQNTVELVLDEIQFWSNDGATLKSGDRPNYTIQLCLKLTSVSFFNEPIKVWFELKCL